jgi:hypothetical protein
MRQLLDAAHSLCIRLRLAILAFHKKYLHKQLKEGVTWYSGIMGLRKEGGDSDRQERERERERRGERNARENAKKGAIRIWFITDNKSSLQKVHN